MYHLLVGLGLTATAAYVLVLLGALTLNGVAAAQMLTDVGVAFVPAGLGGALMIALPFVANELGVLQLVMLWPMLFGLGALHRYFVRPSYPRALVIAVWVAVALFTSEYYAFFLLIALVVVTIVYVVKRQVRVAQLGHAAAALGVLVAVVGPFVVAQSSRVADYAWPDGVVASLGANGSDWLRLRARAVGASLPLIGAGGVRNSPCTRARCSCSSPIWVSQALADRSCVGSSQCSCSARARRSWHSDSASTSSAPSRTAFLRDHVAGFGRLRSPFRWAVLTQMRVVLLAGSGPRCGVAVAPALGACARHRARDDRRDRGRAASRSNRDRGAG